MSKILVVGSVAFDIVFEVHNNFKDEVIIKDGKILDVSMMLTAQNKEVFFGGTGANIAYGLGIQGMHPSLFSVVGKDFFPDYSEHLANQGVNLHLVEKRDEYCATFYGISDTAKEQIGIFQPNVHGDYMEEISLSDKFTNEELKDVKIAIFSPGTGKSIVKHMEELRSVAMLTPIIIFDPSQILSIFFTEKMLLECIEMSNIFIGNETEIAQALKMLQLSSPKDLVNMGLDYVIETLGKNGSKIYSATETKLVESVKVQNFVEQTGAGDAFRAGLIKGMYEGLSVVDSCRIGSILASENIQAKGSQNYKL